MQKIAESAAAQGLSLTRLAEEAGLGRDTLTVAARRGGTPGMPSLLKIANRLGLSPNDFLVAPKTPETSTLRGEVRATRVRRPRGPDMVKDLPVRGTAAGSALNGFEISPNVIEYVRRPPALDGVDDAYAIYVVSSSMEPLHKPGDLCFVHPWRHVRAGDSVIIQVQTRPGAAVEAYIKTFARKTEGEILARQLNPPANLAYKRPHVLALHKVMTMNELFGV